MEGPERVVCCTLCMCMAVAVFSSVALVYLTRIVYVPAKREIQSGLSHVPAMCTTIERLETDECDWISCYEWCLSKSNHCVKLWAQVRKNGTDIVLDQCTNIQDITYKVILQNIPISISLLIVRNVIKKNNNTLLILISKMLIHDPV